MRSVQKCVAYTGYLSICMACSGMLSSQVEAAPVFDQLVAPMQSTLPTGLTFYADKNGALNLLYANEKSQTTGNIEYLVFDNEHWSTPIDTGGLNQNRNTLAGVVNLSNGTPLMLIKGDDTDYGTLLGLSSAPTEPENETDPIIPGMTDATLTTMLDDNQRLYASFYTNTGWSAPQLIPNTSRAGNPLLTAGDQGGALVIFTLDADNDTTTMGDQELSYSVFSNHTWSNPTPITNNSVAEFGVSAIYTNGQYMATWVTDEDNNPDTSDDWKFHYTTIALNGQINTPQAVTNQLQTETVPILSVVQNQATLFWQGEAVSETDPRRPILTTQFSTAWAIPTPTGLFGLQLLNGSVYATGGGELLVYYDSGTVQAALNQQDGWHAVGVLANINRTGFDLSELEHFLDQNNELWLAIAAHIPAVGEAENGDEAGDGVFVARMPLAYDLAPTLINSTPNVKHIGQQSTVEINVGNLGQFPSPNYSVVIRQNNQVLASLNGTPIAPGQTQALSHSLTQAQAIIPLDIEIIADANDSNPANNRRNYDVKVLPDFAVRSVKKQGNNRIVADVVERKGIAAAPVAVDIYLADAATSNLVASTTFNPNIAEPIVVESADLINKPGEYQIQVVVNKTQSVQEDNYSNNQNAFKVKPAPDFLITRLEGDSDTIRVTVRNQGDLPVVSVDLLLTDDPEQAISSTLPVTPWFYQPTVFLGNNGEASIEIQRSTQPAPLGNTLYAVVNPLGQLSEKDRNNNRSKLILTTAAAPPTGGELPTAKLELASLSGWCQNIQATIENSGDVSIIGPGIEVFNAGGASVAHRYVPLVSAGESQDITFNGLAYGTYTVQLSFQNQLGQIFTAQDTVSLTETASCAASANQDANLINLALSDPGATSADLLLSVTLSAAAYDASYRKPLVRLPIQIAVKQGTNTVYTDSPVLYLPADQLAGAGHNINIVIPRAVFPSGTTRVEVTVLERNDENNITNNTHSIDVNAEAL